MIIHQPYNEQLGISIINEINSGNYNQLTIMVAYAKLSGVLRLIPCLREFKKNGNSIRCIVGIDQQNTTLEALEYLDMVANEFYIFHSEGFSQTFHVKCYWLSNTDICWHAIGSNNLTAGGLFSNYEMSEVVQLEGEDAHQANKFLESIYQSYAASNSACSLAVDQSLLSRLKEYKYVVREIDQRKELAQKTKQNNTERNSKNSISLFGKEQFSAPDLPNEFQHGHKANSSTKTGDVQKSRRVSEPTEIKAENITKTDDIYLIRHVPKAGNRSKQVHFTMDILSAYFCLKAGDHIIMQELLPSGDVGDLEERQIVLSSKNKNVKIELAGAAILDENYPEDPNKRPILIIKKVDATNVFSYMLILDGYDGYNPINNRLKMISPGRSLPYEVIDEDTMFSLWEECPLV